MSHELLASAAISLSLIIPLAAVGGSAPLDLTRYEVGPCTAQSTAKAATENRAACIIDTSTGEPLGL